ncbi:MAG: hypothetical protein WCV82_04455 [Candidatus Paceibacterota bacterium]
MSATSTELVIVPGIEANKLALITPESAHAVKAAYLPHFTAFLDLEKAALNAAVNRPKEARIIRLDLRKIRLAADKSRIDLGTEARHYKEAVDQVYNLLEDRIAPLEKRLGDIEKAEELAEKARVDKLKQERFALLSPFVDATFYDLGNMPDGQWTQLYDQSKASFEAKKAAEAKAEADRIALEAAKEAERIRLKAENDKLAKEAQERQKALDAERAKVEQERKKAQAEADRLKKEADAKLNRERAAHEALLAAERRVAAQEQKDREVLEKAAQLKRDEEARKLAAETAKKEAAAKAERDVLTKQAEDARKAAQKLADEAKARQDAENVQKAREAEEAAKAAKAPDKAKLLSFAKMILNLHQVNPKLTTPAGIKLSATITAQVDKFAKWVESEAGKL